MAGIIAGMYVKLLQAIRIARQGTARKAASANEVQRNRSVRHPLGEDMVAGTPMPRAPKVPPFGCGANYRGCVTAWRTTT